MPRLEQTSITEQVYASLLRDIEAGRLKPGARIVEQTLSADFGISKTPLRLALHQLKQDGIVRIEPRRGMYVATPTPTELRELIEIREVLEGLAARRAARKPTKQLVSRLKACFAGLDEKTMHEQRVAYAAADHRFHKMLLQASGSTELVASMNIVGIRLHLNRMRKAAAKRHDLRSIHREHLAIIKALESGDAHEVERLVRSHVRHQLALTLDIEGPAAAPGSSTAGRAA